jgi:hypothetical protein
MNHDWSHAQIGHEMTVHDIDVNALGSSSFRLEYLLSEPAEVGGQN